MFDTYEKAKDFFDRMVDEHPSAIRIDMESVDEDGDCLELVDTHGVYYTDMRNWEKIAADAWARSRQEDGAETDHEPEPDEEEDYDILDGPDVSSTKRIHTRVAENALRMAPVHAFPSSRLCPAKGELASAQILGLGLQDAGWPMQGNGAQ